MNTQRWTMTCGAIVAACLTMAHVGQTTAQAQQLTVRGSGEGQGNQTSTDEQELPRIRYGSSRSSSGWVETPRGASVAIDDGITWKDRDYYLSLTWNLVATPHDKTTALWAHSVSAFWNQLGIERQRDDAGETREVLALRSTVHPDFVEYRSLTDGTRIGGTSDTQPGEPVELLASWKGDQAASDRPLRELLLSAEEWKKTHDALFQDVEGAPPADLGIDWEQACVVVIFAGKSSNCNGFSGNLYRAGGKSSRLILRVVAHTYQSAGDPPPTWPYGVFVIPRERGELEVQRDTQNLIGGPAMWKTWQTWEIPPAR